MGDTRPGPYGKMSPAPCQALGDMTFRPCSKRSQKPRFQCLDLADGQMPGWYEATELISLGGCSTPVCGESPSAAVESFLSQVLEPDAPERYFLSRKACDGILRRAQKRGKELPPMLKEALMRQALSG